MLITQRLTRQTASELTNSVELDAGYFQTVLDDGRCGEKTETRASNFVMSLTSADRLIQLLDREEGNVWPHA